jgi:replicative DNA helicase
MNALVKVPDLPRAPPVNIAAEQAVLGAILMNNEAFGRVSRFLEARHFCEDLHRRIYEVAGKLIEDGKVASPVTLKTFLGDHDLGGITVTQYLARLCSEAVTVLNCGDYAATLVDLFCQREIMMVAEDMSSLAACLPVGIRPSAVIDEISERLHKLREETATDEVSVSVADTMDELIERAVAASEGRHVPGMLTGLTDVDRTIGGGLRPGRLVVLAGRPGAGKTVLLTAIARRAAQKGAGVAIFSLEIDRDENLARMAANALAHKNHAPDYRDILTQALDAGQIEDLRVARDWLAKLPLELDCTGGI